MFEDLAKATDKYEAAIAVQPEAAFPNSERVDKDKRVPRQKKIVVDKPSGGETKKRRPAKERWFYEPVLPAGTPMLASVTTSENPGVPGISSDSLLPDFGPTEDLPGLLEFAEDCEGTAWELQGVVFKDNILGWCKVTGWGVDLGVNMIYYAPVGQEFSSNHEHHVSLAEILTVIRQQPFVSKISDYRPSRQLESSGSSGPQNKIMRILSAKRKCPMFGTMFARRLLDLPTQAKTLSSKIITKILKAHESMFKYGTFIPRSDREAEKSPEAPRWRSGRIGPGIESEVNTPIIKRKILDTCFTSMIINIQGSIGCVWSSMDRDKARRHIVLPMHLQCGQNQYDFFICMLLSMDGQYNNTMFLKRSCDLTPTVLSLYIHRRDNQIFRDNY